MFKLINKGFRRPVRAIEFIQERLNLIILRLILPFKKFNPEEAIIISSESRGGSTWLMEMLSEAPGMVVMWEPLHRDRGILLKDVKLGENPFMPENEKNKKLEQNFNDIFGFKNINLWTMSFCGIKDLIKAERVLVKFIRANLLLPWIVENIELRYKPIFLLRHPIAVALSQLTNFHKDKQLLPFEIPEGLNNQRFTENLDYLNCLKTNLEVQVAIWCLNNLPTINHPEHGKKWFVIYYEDLVLNPTKSLNFLNKMLNLNLPIEVIDPKSPSQTDFNNDLEKDRIKQLNKWKDNLDAETLNNLQDILDHFKVSIYSAHNVLPIKKSECSSIKWQL